MGQPQDIAFGYCFLFPEHQNCAQLFTDKDAFLCSGWVIMMLFLLAPFPGVGCSSFAAATAPSWCQQGERVGGLAPNLVMS